MLLAYGVLTFCLEIGFWLDLSRLAFPARPAQRSSTQLSPAQPSPAKRSPAQPAQPSSVQPSPAQPSPAQRSAAQLSQPYRIDEPDLSRKRSCTLCKAFLFYCKRLSEYCTCKPWFEIRSGHNNFWRGGHQILIFSRTSAKKEPLQNATGLSTDLHGSLRCLFAHV